MGRKIVEDSSKSKRAQIRVLTPPSGVLKYVKNSAQSCSGGKEELLQIWQRNQQSESCVKR